MAVEDDLEEMEEEIWRWKEDFMCDLKWQWDCYKSVARIRLVKAENPSACVTMNCKVGENSGSAVNAYSSELYE
jgi:hypothetical protein